MDNLFCSACRSRAFVLRSSFWEGTALLSRGKRKHCEVTKALRKAGHKTRSAALRLLDLESRPQEHLEKLRFACTSGRRAARVFSKAIRHLGKASRLLLVCAVDGQNLTSISEEFEIANFNHEVVCDELMDVAQAASGAACAP